MAFHGDLEQGEKEKGKKPWGFGGVDGVFGVFLSGGGDIFVGFRGKREKKKIKKKRKKEKKGRKKESG